MGIADFLFSKGQQRILGATLREPSRVFTQRELLDISNSGGGAGQAQVAKLIAAGVLIELPKNGRERKIQINREFPLFPELRSIALKSFALLDGFKEAFTPYQDEIDEAFIFGSVAKGIDDHLSDVDLMVIGTIELITVYKAIAPMQAALDRDIHVNLYSPTQWRDLRLQDEVLRAIDGGPKLLI